MPEREQLSRYVAMARALAERGVIGAGDVPEAAEVLRASLAQWWVDIERGAIRLPEDGL